MIDKLLVEVTLWVMSMYYTWVIKAQNVTKNLVPGKVHEKYIITYLYAGLGWKRAASFKFTIYSYLSEDEEFWKWVWPWPTN